MNESEFEKLRGFYLEELNIGQQAITSKTITEADIVLFSAVTGDNNPVHTSEAFAEKTIFKKRVSHGFLTASLISTVIGTKLPGPGSIYVKQSLFFLAPVYPGDTVNIKVIVKSIDNIKRRVTLETYCEKNGEKVLNGEAVILVKSNKN